MESKAKLLGHPVHPQLIVFPLALLGMAVVFDIICGVDPAANLEAPSSLPLLRSGAGELPDIK